MTRIEGCPSLESIREAADFYWHKRLFFGVSGTVLSMFSKAVMQFRD